MVNICCAFRGYKVEDVEARTLYTAGQLPTMDVVPAHIVHDEAEMVVGNHMSVIEENPGSTNGRE